MITNIRTKAKQIFCNHQDTDFSKWDWCYSITGEKQNELKAEYVCKKCGKQIGVHLKGREAADFATVMENWRQK